MRLKIIVILMLVMTWILILLSVHTIALNILKRSYTKIDERSVVAGLRQAYKVVGQLESGINSVVINWSVWNDAYQFVIDKNDAFIKSNFSVTSIVSTDLDMVLFYNINGELVHGYSLNLDRTKEAPVPQDLLKSFSPQGQYRKIIENPQVNKGSSGLISNENGILYYAAHSIITSTGQGPARGTLIMARYLNAQTIDRIKKRTKQDLVLYDETLSQENYDLSKKYQKLLQNDPLIDQQGNLIAAYSLVKDINQKPIGIFKVTQPRIASEVGKSTIRQFNRIFLGVSIIFTILLFYLLNLFLVKRLEKINEKTSEPKKTLDSLPRKYQDEIDYIQQETNELSLNAHVDNQENKNITHIIKDKQKEVATLSEKLKESENFLKNIINSSASMIIILDEKMNILMINRSTETEVGQSSDSLKNKEVFSIFPYLSSKRKTLEDALTQNHSVKLERVSFKTEANTQYFNLILHPYMCDEKILLIIAIDDVTEKVKFEERLLQSAKLISIGMLTAGISQEITNPINFLSGSTVPLENNLSAIIKLINTYKGIKTKDDFLIKQDEINKWNDKFDLKSTLKETNELLDGIQIGASRIADIVKNLKFFFRFDNEKMTSNDIHLGIDATLVLLQHKLNGNISVIKNYGSLPNINCFPGKLNQVFMNILSNAIEAIREKGEIKITTNRLDEHHIEISIKDNGVGMSKENLEKLSDPSFSAQEAGLGLGICQAIIREHNGSIKMKSELNHGTEFIIVLPI